MAQKTVPDILQYTSGIIDTICVHRFSTSAQAAYFLWKNKNIFIWNILSCYEGLPISLPDTETILNGYSVDKVNINDMLKVRAYGQAVELLCKDVLNNNFIGDRYDLIELHRIAAHNEIECTQLGTFRRENVVLRNVRWRPPNFEALPLYWNQVEEMISDDNNIIERSLIVFLQLCRIQFFPDVNKRTATLFANGLLMKNGYAPFMVPAEEMGEFSKLLSYFYESGRADNMLKFLASTSVIIQENNNEKCTQNDPSNLFLQHDDSLIKEDCESVKDMQEVEESSISPSL